jgi:peptide/nickel transport system substrate-binding protein
MRTPAALLTAIVLIATACASAAPTVAPTVAPTSAATVAPTVAETVAPTAAATAAVSAEPTTAAPTEAPSVAASQAAGGNDTLKVALSAEPQSLDPMVDSSGETQNILHNVFDSLVIADDQLKQTGDLAESWKFSPPSSWDFTLRQGVKFHNGDPVTADDVKYSFDRILDPANKSAMQGFISGVTAVTIQDPQTVRVTTATPSAILPEIVKNVMVVPKKAVEAVGAQAFGKAPVGSGPYRFVDWVPGDHITLAANPDYWAGAASIKNLILRPISEPSTRVASLESGQVDLISGFAPSFVDELKSNANLNVVNDPESRTAEIILDTNPADNFKPFQDVRVRQALNYAIDYDTLINQVMGGLAKRNCNPVPPVFFGYDASIQCPTFDVTKAKDLLTQAGYGSGFDVTFGGTSGAQPNDIEIEQAIVGMLANVGIRAKLETPEFGVWLDNYHQRKWPMVFHTNGDVVLDADQVFGLFYTSGGRKYFTTPEMDKLVAASENEFDAAKRLPLVQGVIKQAVDQAVWVSLFNMPDLWAMNAKLNFTPRGDEWTVMTRASWKP